MKELDVKVNDTLYWGEQEWKCKEINPHSLDFPLCFQNKKNDYSNWFTRFGQLELNLPPVLSFTSYDIEKGGATFERPTNLLKPVDVTKLQKVRFKDYENEKWEYGFFIGRDKTYEFSYSCLPKYNILYTGIYRLCEPYEWEESHVIKEKSL